MTKNRLSLTKLNLTLKKHSVYLNALRGLVIFLWGKAKTCLVGAKNFCMMEKNSCDAVIFAHLDVLWYKVDIRFCICDQLGFCWYLSSELNNNLIWWLLILAFSGGKTQQMSCGQFLLKWIMKPAVCFHMSVSWISKQCVYVPMLIDNLGTTDCVSVD